MTLPKAGPYRLFRWASDRRQLLRCRACRNTFKVSGQWRHLETEIRRWGSEDALAARLKFLARARKSRRNLAHSRFEYAIGRKRDWRAMDQEDVK